MTPGMDKRSYMTLQFHFLSCGRELLTSNWPWLFLCLRDRVGFLSASLDITSIQLTVSIYSYGSDA